MGAINVNYGCNKRKLKIPQKSWIKPVNTTLHKDRKKLHKHISNICLIAGGSLNSPALR